MNTEIILSNPATIKAYFQKVLQLAKDGQEFPVLLDEVWPLVYPRKDHAIRSLRKDFMQDVDFQVFPIFGEKGRPEESYRLSTACMEFFIARKVREVFEVYRQVFHKVAEPTALSQLDILAQSVQILQQQAREIAEVKSLQAEQGEAIRMLEAKTTTIPDYFTVAGYANLNRINVGLKIASSVGQKASRICKERGIPTESCPDPRFGTVNMYPSTVLREVFSQPIQ